MHNSLELEELKFNKELFMAWQRLDVEVDNLRQKSECKSESEKRCLFLSLKQEYQKGDQFIGQIIIKAPVGLFLDIGEDFIALLKITEINSLDYGRYRDDESFNLGERIRVQLLNFDHNSFQIIVSDVG